MRKIMFDDKYGLETAVIERLKTMTRRIESANSKPYQIGEVLAVAQSYKSVYEELEEKKGNSKANEWWCDLYERIGDPTKHAGYRNKMFVRADLMPHRIRITNTKLERLQDISDEDCYKEGIVHFEWRQYLKQDDDDFGPQQYNERDLWSVPLFRESFLNPWGESSPEEFAADSAKTAFAVLIFKMMSRKVWLCNPWVYAYEFELLNE